MVPPPPPRLWFALPETNSSHIPAANNPNNITAASNEVPTPTPAAPGHASHALHPANNPGAPRSSLLLAPQLPPAPPLGARSKFLLRNRSFGAESSYAASSGSATASASTGTNLSRFSFARAAAAGTAGTAGTEAQKISTNTAAAASATGASDLTSFFGISRAPSLPYSPIIAPGEPDQEIRPVSRLNKNNNSSSSSSTTTTTTNVAAAANDIDDFDVRVENLTDDDDNADDDDDDGGDGRGKFDKNVKYNENGENAKDEEDVIMCSVSAPFSATNPPPETPLNQVSARAHAALPNLGCAPGTDSAHSTPLTRREDVTPILDLDLNLDLGLNSAARKSGIPAKDPDARLRELVSLTGSQFGAAPSTPGARIPRLLADMLAELSADAEQAKDTAAQTKHFFAETSKTLTAITELVAAVATAQQGAASSGAAQATKIAETVHSVTDVLQNISSKLTALSYALTSAEQTSVAKLAAATARSDRQMAETRDAIMAALRADSERQAKSVAELRAAFTAHAGAARADARDAQESFAALAASLTRSVSDDLPRRLEGAVAPLVATFEKMPADVRRLAAQVSGLLGAQLAAAEGDSAKLRSELADLRAAHELQSGHLATVREALDATKTLSATRERTHAESLAVASAERLRLSDELAEAKRSSADLLSAAESRHRVECDALRASHCEAETTLRDSHREFVAKLNARFESEMLGAQQMRVDAEALARRELERVVAEHRAQLEERSSQLNSRVAENERLKSQKEELERQLQRSTDELRAAMAQLEAVALATSAVVNSNEQQQQQQLLQLQTPGDRRRGADKSFFNIFSPPQTCRAEPGVVNAGAIAPAPPDAVGGADAATSCVGGSSATADAAAAAAAAACAGCENNNENTISEDMDIVFAESPVTRRTGDKGACGGLARSASLLTALAAVSTQQQQPAGTRTRKRSRVNNDKQ